MNGSPNPSNAMCRTGVHEHRKNLPHSVFQLEVKKCIGSHNTVPPSMQRLLAVRWCRWDRLTMRWQFLAASPVKHMLPFSIGRSRRRILLILHSDHRPDFFLRACYNKSKPNLEGSKMHIFMAQKVKSQHSLTAVFRLLCI